MKLALATLRTVRCCAAAITTALRRAAPASLSAMMVVAISASEGIAQRSIACGENLYVVQPGDSLSGIAQRAYSSFNYQHILNANPDVLSNPSVLLVGQRLFIPCLDGTGLRSKAEASEMPTFAMVRLDGQFEANEQSSDGGPRGTLAQEEDEAEVAAASPIAPASEADRPVRFLTGSGFAPFTHRDLPEGGMLTELVNRAMMRADPSRRYELTWENDWTRHLSELLPEGEYDLGFPWYRPDCSAIEKLSEPMRKSCTEFDYSRPLYEVVIGYYLQADAPEVAARKHTALFGKRLCRPAGYVTFDLEEVDLVEPNVEMVTPPTPGECFEMLARGEVDVVTVNVLLGEHEIAELGLEGRFVDAPDLASTETLHVLAPKSDPYGQNFLQLIDKGLRQIRDEGVWLEITSRHLVERAKGL